MERLKVGDPEQIGPWQIVNRLGSGGMGLVYMGTNGTRAAAIKIVRDFLLEDPTSRTRLSREVSNLKKVKSPFVAEIVGADIDHNPAWIATNYVDGPSLKTLIENEGTLSDARWFEFAYGLFSALFAVHDVGIIHRDVKPSNILMSANGPRLIDFGISFSSDATSLTKTGMVAGTPTWFAPEQFQNKKITPAVDVFAAGSILYYAATGNSPWGKEDSSVANTMNQILTKEVDLSVLTDAQRSVIGPLLEKDPKNRADAAEALEIIESSRILAGVVSYSKGKTVSLSLRTTKSKIIALLTIAVLGVGGYFFNQNFNTSNSSNTNQSESAKPTITPITKWSVRFDGDAVAQTGAGTSFKAYVCDQGVITESLKIKELTVPAAKVSPTTTVITGDARCGKEFDTIVISGEISGNKDSRDYILAGSTRTGFIIQYEFTVKKENSK
jgi:serine/threonine protein kinase